VASRTAERKFAAEFAGYVLSDDKFFGIAAGFAGYVLGDDKYIGIAAEFAGYVLNDDKWTFFQKKQLECHARL
jgi:hypothetical protein